VFFLARKQNPERFSPNPSNCNLQARTGFFVDLKNWPPMPATAVFGENSELRWT